MIFNLFRTCDVFLQGIDNTCLYREILFVTLIFVMKPYRNVSLRQHQNLQLGSQGSPYQKREQCPRIKTKISKIKKEIVAYSI